MKYLCQLLILAIICLLPVEICMEREVSDIEDDEEDEFVKIYGSEY